MQGTATCEAIIRSFPGRVLTVTLLCGRKRPCSKDSCARALKKGRGQDAGTRVADFAAGHAPASISATDEFVLLHSAGQHDGLLAGAGLETCTPVQYGLDHATLVRTTDAVLRI